MFALRRQFRRELSLYALQFHGQSARHSCLDQVQLDRPHNMFISLNVPFLIFCRFTRQPGQVICAGDCRVKRDRFGQNCRRRTNTYYCLAEGVQMALSASEATGATTVLESYAYCTELAAFNVDSVFNVYSLQQHPLKY